MMLRRSGVGFCIMLALIGAAVVTCTSQSAALTTWTLPQPDSMPQWIAVNSTGEVYFTEYTTNKIGLLDPDTNEIRERDALNGPAGLVLIDDDSVCYTARLDNAVQYLDFTGGSQTWPLPTAAASPNALVSAPGGIGPVNVWFTERSAAQVGRLAPATMAVTMPLIVSQPKSVTPNTATLTPVVSLVSPVLYPGNPLLPPPIYYIPGVLTGAITEWAPLNTSAPVEDVAIAPDGRAWFTQGINPLTLLDPTNDTFLAYGLPPGTDAVGVTVAASGNVWFTDVSRPAIGRLDPTTGDVTLWTIPTGSQPLDLVVDDDGNVWFTDRAGDALGNLVPFENRIMLYSMPFGTHPLYLTIDDAGAVWFTSERRNLIGRLVIIPVLGPPTTVPGSTAGASAILGYGIAHVGRRAQISVTYSYDGSMGLPVWIGLNTLSAGSLVPNFSYVPYRINQAGTGTANIELEYQGTQAVHTDTIEIVIYPSGGPPFVTETIDYIAAWTP